MDIVLGKLQEQNIDSLCSELCDKGIFYVIVCKEDNYGLSIVFCDSVVCDQVIFYFSFCYCDLVIFFQGDNSLKVVMIDECLKEVCEYVVQQNINILCNCVNQLGVVELLVQCQGVDCIVVELLGIQDIVCVKEIFGVIVIFEFCLVNINVDQFVVVFGCVLGDLEVKQMCEGQLVVLYKWVILIGDYIIDLIFSMDEYNQLQVNILLDSVGGNIMFNFIKDNIGKLMVILFVEYKDSGKKDVNGCVILVKEEEVINIVNIQLCLGNSFCIIGISNLNEVCQLLLLLCVGVLIVLIQIVEEWIIGLILGMQNIKQGLEVCLVGLVVFILFMIFFYKKFGLIVILVLIVNLILIVGIMFLILGVMLIMLGIVGIVLIFVVVVDVNVLINECIKEELSNGCIVQQVIDEGYCGVFSLIFDVNVMMFIKVIILYVVGIGVIKGFVIIIGIGIVILMFIVIVGICVIVNLLYGGKCVKKLFI